MRGDYFFYHASEEQKNKGDVAYIPPATASGASYNGPGCKFRLSSRFQRPSILIQFNDVLETQINISLDHNLTAST